MVGREGAPHAVRLCLGAVRSRAELEKGLQTVAEILAALEPVEVTGLQLEFVGECALSMSTVPPEYESVEPETSVEFEVTFTAPEEPGIYSCTVSARDDADVSYGEQAVQGHLVRLATVAALDAAEGLGLDQDQGQGAALGQAGGDLVEFLVRVKRKHCPRPSRSEPPTTRGRKASIGGRRGQP